MAGGASHLAMLTEDERSDSSFWAHVGGFLARLLIAAVSLRHTD
jgi:hypothetical protein